MIEVNELRIGIILKPIRPRHHEEFITVESFDGAIVNCTFRGYDLDELHPIPLTEEILLNKCKAEKVGSEWQIEYNDTTFIFEGSLGRGYYYTGGEGCKLSVLFYNLHQLQNLYFALTGEELEFKS